jgi:hypothetical protein
MSAVGPEAATALRSWNGEFAPIAKLVDTKAKSTRLQLGLHALRSQN